MKKIFAVVLCLMLASMMNVVAFAAETDAVVEETTVESTEETTTETASETTPVATPDESLVEDSVEDPDEVTDETPDETPDEVLDETPYEDPDETPNETPKDDEKSDAQIEAEFTTDKIVNYITEHLEEVSVILTMILTVFYQVRKHNSLNKSVGILNNNAVTVAENSSIAINDALAAVRSVSDTVVEYKGEINRLLAEVRSNEEEKQNLAAALAGVDNHLKTAKLANKELANEVAELLVLANIPNSKKEELYARHRAAVAEIEAAENTEVKEDDGKES